MRENIPIMLVEDDDVDAENVIRAFQKNKITNPLYIVNNGEEALALLNNEAPYEDLEKHRRPGIILLDINMPLMSGIEFLKVIKADEKFMSIPVIVLTTSKEENDRVESFKLSVAGYVIKPVEFADFIKVVKTIDLYWTLSELG